MTDPTDRCLDRPSQPKTASATLYLMEELGDARLRCDQLVRYVDEAVKLIEKSEKKDHFFEVAGHLIQGIPETAFKLQKALQAVALAADRIDYEELKQELRPEKVEELERVLQDVRIRTVPHRSEIPPMNPKQAAKTLREFVLIAREEGSVPVHDIATFLTQLDPPGVTAAQERTAADKLEKLAEMLEDPNQEPLSRVRLAAVIRRVAMEATIDDAVRLAATQEDSEEETGKTAALDLSIAALFDSLKDKALVAMRAAHGERWRAALMQLYFMVDDIGTILVQVGGMDTNKSEALKREIRHILPNAAKSIGEMPEAMPVHMASEGLAWDIEAADRGLVKAIEALLRETNAERTLNNGNQWKASYEGFTIRVGDPEGSRTKSFDYDIRDSHNHATQGKAKTFGSLSKKIAEAIESLKARDKSASDVSWKAAEEKLTKFEEGKPADPTKNMDADEAKKWKENTDEYGDKFKAATDDEKAARFQEGVSADPTKNMSPEDAKVWKEEHAKNKDNFKEAGGVEDSFVRRIKKHEKELGLGDLSKKLEGSDWKDTIYAAVEKLFMIEGKLSKQEAARKAKDWVKPSMLEALKSGLSKTASNPLSWKA